MNNSLTQYPRSINLISFSLRNKICNYNRNVLLHSIHSDRNVMSEPSTSFTHLFSNYHKEFNLESEELKTFTQSLASKDYEDIV